MTFQGSDQGIYFLFVSAKNFTASGLHFVDVNYYDALFYVSAGNVTASETNYKFSSISAQSCSFDYFVHFNSTSSVEISNLVVADATIAGILSSDTNLYCAAFLGKFSNISLSNVQASRTLFSQLYTAQIMTWSFENLSINNSTLWNSIVTAGEWTEFTMNQFSLTDSTGLQSPSCIAMSPN